MEISLFFLFWAQKCDFGVLERQNTKNDDFYKMSGDEKTFDEARLIKYVSDI